MSATEILLNISSVIKCIKGQTDLVLDCEGDLLRIDFFLKPTYIPLKKKAVNEKPDHLKNK